MDVLLSIDGSPDTSMATSMLQAFRLSSRTRVIVLTVIPEHVFLGGITLGSLRTAARPNREAQEQKASELGQSVVEALKVTRLKAESVIRHGNPAEQILKTAEATGSSLIVLGAKGQTGSSRFTLGSVAHKVMRHARCSVLLARRNTGAIKRVLLAMDGSKHSDVTARFLLDLPLPRRCEIAVVTALQSEAAAWMGMPTLDLQLNQQLLADLQAAEEEAARKITRRAEEQFRSKGYKTISMVVRGRAAESILMAADSYKPEIVALGAKGLSSGFQLSLLGSVAERVARHAGCSVLIGRSPR